MSERIPLGMRTRTHREHREGSGSLEVLRETTDRRSGQKGTQRVSLRIMGLHRGRSQGLLEELDALCDVLETAEQQNPRVRGLVLE